MHARIYTCDAARSWADCLAWRSGRLCYVGDEAGLAPFLGSSTRVRDLQGRMVLPGFIDSHVHVLSSGVELGRCLVEAASVGEIETLVRAYRPTSEWLVGSGWALPLFPASGPTRELLDAWVPDRPAALYAYDGHSLWCNSRALAQAHLDASTVDPPGGRIERDAKGQPTGTLRENAMRLVEAVMPALPVEERLTGLRRGLAEAHRFGLTVLGEASVSPGDLDAYELAERQGWLTAHIVAFQLWDVLRGEEQLAGILDRRQRFSSKLVHPQGVKIFLDGVLESFTAAVVQPYLGIPARDNLQFQPERLNRVVALLQQNCLQVHVHAIGDRAVRVALDSFAAAGRSPLRHQSAHLQLVDPADRPRFRELGVIANVQGFWAQLDPYAQMVLPSLGPPRGEQQYPIASLLQSGAVVVGGSDWSVTSLNPLDAIQVAVTRQPLDGSGSPWLPTERAGLAEMLAAYTIKGAYAAHLEAQTGSLEVGKSADLVVLDKNLFDLPPGDIGKAKVLTTVFQGRPVYGRLGE